MKSHIVIIFLLLSFFGTIINEGCEDIQNPNRNDCFSFSTPDQYCCFDGTSQCKLVDKDKLKDYYQYDCSITDSNYGKYEFGQYHPNQILKLDFISCGTYKPEKSEDCTEYSEINNSCCLFQRGNEKSCYFIGRESKQSGNYDGISINCYSSNLVLKFYLLLLIFFLL